MSDTPAPNVPDVQQAMDELISLSPDADLEQIDRVIGKVDAIKRLAGEAKRMLNEALAEWIEQNGEFVIGTKRWYVGTTSRTKCVDAAKTFEALLETLGPGGVAECLSSQPFKHGATRSELEKQGLPEVYEQHFVTEKTKDAKTGKPKKGVMYVDENFLPKSGGGH